jgi:hypothetical protein
MIRNNTVGEVENDVAANETRKRMHSKFPRESILTLSRDRVQPTLNHYSENGGRRYGCFSTQIVAFRMKMIVSLYIGIPMAFDYTLRAFV